MDKFKTSNLKWNYRPVVFAGTSWLTIMKCQFCIPIAMWWNCRPRNRIKCNMVFSWYWYEICLLCNNIMRNIFSYNDFKLITSNCGDCQHMKIKCCLRSLWLKERYNCLFLFKNWSWKGGISSRPCYLFPMIANFGWINYDYDYEMEDGQCGERVNLHVLDPRAVCTKLRTGLTLDLV